jgi:adenylate kinase family enzyme
MKRIAVFGNGGAGKSTLARRLAELTGLPLYHLDQIQYVKGGGKLPHDEYLRAHADLVKRDAWIIDGYGCTASSWERFAAADTLVYVDLPLFISYLRVTKRFVKSLLGDPEGYPEDSPMWRSTLQAYRIIPLCERHLAPKYRQLAAESAASKRVHHLKSPGAVRAFLAEVGREYSAVIAAAIEREPRRS